MKRILLIFAIITVISCQAFQNFSVPNKATRKLLLELHNIERREHDLHDLSWSSELATASQDWANYLAGENRFKHSGTAWVGENIARATYRSNMTEQLFSQWSSQKKYFNPNVTYGKESSNDTTKGVGHYTQVIWGMSFEVGCGIANSTKWWVLVCQYRYTGNYVDNWVYKPDPNNPWKAAKPVLDPTTLIPPPELNSYPDVLDKATIKQLVDLHNTERTFVGTANVTWNTTIAAQAQAHANKQAKAGTFYKSGIAGFGENMKLVTRKPNVVNYMFNQWANQKVNYDATLTFPKCSINGKGISHYTQIIWGRTTQIGCGLATNSKNSILVCHYNPPGNYVGSYPIKPVPEVNFNFTRND